MLVYFKIDLFSECGNAKMFSGKAKQLVSALKFPGLRFRKEVFVAGNAGNVKQFTERL